MPSDVSARAHHSGNPTNSKKADHAALRYFTPQVQLHDVSMPILLWVSDVPKTTFETKPKGQPGWKNFSLGANRDLCVSNAVEHGSAG
ncbi:MAG: hypothetical protein EOP02_01015 [Proteobacteria bacterium]|nr:MAG: hypothetical protein EOP02_01015 [Pseudomonadota bacterium]